MKKNDFISYLILLYFSFAISLFIFSVGSITRIMTYLEEKGIIHGNLCCENLLRKENDHLKLCDFEISQSISSLAPLKDISRIKWCPPEVKMNNKFDIKSDL